MSTSFFGPEISRFSVLRYLLPVLLVPAAVLAAGFYIIPSEWFGSHSGNPYLASLGYGETLRNANCDVLIYGDSSTMTSLDPLQIESATGLRACNIAEFIGQTTVSGTDSVDRYLRRNRPPRYLLFAFAPEDYTVQSEDWNHHHVTEAITWRLKYDRSLNTALLFAHHPAALLAWDENGLHSLFSFLRQPAMAAELRESRARNHGRLPAAGPSPTECSAILQQDLDLKGMANLRRKYGTNGTTVILDVVPVPTCDPSFDFYNNRFGLVFDNSFVRYPLQDYVNNGRLHMNSTGSARFTSTVVEQLQTLQKGP